MPHDHNHENHTEHTTPTKTKKGFSKFLPLVVILSVIILFTAIMVYQTGEWDTMYAMRIFMGAFFVVFGGFKALNWKGFVNAYGMYDVIAKRSRAYGYAYPAIELGLGLAFLANWNILAVSWITLAIMIVGAVGVGMKLREKEEIPCACLGVVFKIPMTKVTLFEDLLMAAMAVYMITVLG